ncbi:MAG: hypothetical protein ABL936_00195 [Aestuariivirga sp.]
MTADVIPIGIGCYTISEASRLLRIPALNIRRWLGGYSYTSNGVTHALPPLWKPQLPGDDEHIELGFRDLIELRFVQGFMKEGLSLITIRNCLEYAKEFVNDEYPFSTRRFRTDGKTIFLDSANRTGKNELLDLKRKQFAIKLIIERTFRDLDLELGTVRRWRPFKGKQSIIIDPERALGQPVAANYGVPTIALFQAFKAEGSVETVARFYEVTPQTVKDSVAFEESLAA